MTNSKFGALLDPTWLTSYQHDRSLSSPSVRSYFFMCFTVLAIHSLISHLRLPIVAYAPDTSFFQPLIRPFTANFEVAHDPGYHTDDPCQL